MAWFSYLILSLNKIISIYYLVFALSGLRVKTRCWEWRGVDGIKKLRNTGVLGSTSLTKIK